MSAPDAPCDYLEWDSRFFGRRIGRVRTRRLTPDGLERVLRWAEAEAIDCLYYLGDASDATSSWTAQEGGFRFVDARVTRVRELDRESRETPEGIGLFRGDDLPALRTIARVSHETTRFFHDRHFPRDCCARLYETWIENSCTGTADAVLVARDAAGAAGYLSCLLRPDDWGDIELVAVAPDRRRRGLGDRLMQGALVWFAGQGCRQVRMVSQARNVPAARLCERLGFRTLTVEHWYHLWTPGSSAGGRA